jgi:hypothetical protein
VGDTDFTDIFPAYVRLCTPCGKNSLNPIIHLFTSLIAEGYGRLMRGVSVLKLSAFVFRKGKKAACPAFAHAYFSK